MELQQIDLLGAVAVSCGLLLLLALGMSLLYAKMYRRVEQGYGLVVSKTASVEGLRSVAKRLTFDEVVSDVTAFTDVRHIDTDLQGYVLDDLAFERLAQTPLHALDPDDILDAEAIRRISERTNDAREDTAQRAGARE